MLDRDDLLESLFDSKGAGDAEWRRILSRRADEAIWEGVLRSDASVITSWWRSPSSWTDSGTPVERLSSPAGVKIEVHCVCSPEVAARRFLSRKRHEGHLDLLKTRAELLGGFRQRASPGQPGFARVVKVNTGQKMDLSASLSQIDSALKPSA